VCEYFSPEEMEECCKDPKFCVVCLNNRYDVKVVGHVCKECQNSTNMKVKGGLIRKICPKCGKVLFRGTEREAKNLIIYCPDC
jgi:hypothetical protein